MTAATLTQPALGSGDVEICGFDIAKNDVERKSLEERAYHDVKTALAAQAAHMARNADDRTRAVGLLLAGRREALAGMAWQSSEPMVYELALLACGFLHHPPAERRLLTDLAPSCAQLSIERGAALDADNGLAWMQAATEAAWRGESDNQAHAYRRAAMAPEFRSRAQHALVAITMAAVPTQASPSERTQVMVGIVGVQAAMPIAYAGPLRTNCADDRLRNANTRQECEALADALVQRGTTFNELWMGLNIGRRLGWRTARTAALEAEIRRSDALHQLESIAPGGPMGCAAANRAMHRWAAIAEHGERQAARLLLASPPTSATR